MARRPRVVVVDVPHHITQRGNARQVILADQSDFLVYLDLLRQYSDPCRLSVMGYCLMPNHVHLVAVPHTPTAMAQTLRQTHGRYAAYWNSKHACTGHVWQGRFYSCPLDESHLWTALRYSELNPVRARLAEAPEQWKWSSAQAHSAGSTRTMLEMERWRKRWGSAEWKQYLSAGESEIDLAAIRRSTHSRRPLGTADFVRAIEESTLPLPRPGTDGTFPVSLLPPVSSFS